MANLMTANLPSEDEEDQDYVPDEVDEEERRAAKEKKRPKRLRGAAAGAGAASANSDEEDAGGSGAGGDELEDHDAALPASKREAKRAKVDALWSQLNAAKPAARPAAGASLAALCKPAAAKKGGGDEAWMRQLGLASKPKPSAAAAAGGDKKSVAAAALAAAKAAASVAGASRMATVTVTEQRRFAGQTITVNKEVAKDSKEAAAAAAEAEAAAAAKKQAGLDAVLASLQQAKKVTVLDKSRADWKDFKKTDETIEEELEMHKRSGDQYLDKQAFLKDAELREYEKERDRRLASDVRNRGRL